MEPRNKSVDVLRGMRLEHLRSELDELKRAMEKKSTTLATIEKVTSTIRKLRLSVEGPTESASQSVTEAKTDWEKFVKNYPDPNHRPPWDGKTSEWWFRGDGKWEPFAKPKVPPCVGHAFQEDNILGPSGLHPITGE